MANFSGAPVSDAYYQRVDANDQKSAQNLMKLSQLMQMAQQAQTMRQAPEDLAMKRQVQQAQIESYKGSALDRQAQAEERQLKVKNAARVNEIFNELSTLNPGSDLYKRKWQELQLAVKPESLFAAPVAPKMRDRIVGDKTIQEEFQPDGTWRELGTGPRFAKQIIGAGSSGVPKAPSGYRYTPEGDLEAIKGGPADVKAQIKQQIEVDKAAGVDKQLDAIERNIDKLMTPEGAAKPSLKSYVGQIDQYYPEFAMSSDTAAAGSALKSLQEQMTMMNLAGAKAAVGQSFGSMQVKEWDKFMNLLTNVSRGVPDAEMESNVKFIRNFIRDKRDVLRAAVYGGTYGIGGQRGNQAPSGDQKVMTMQDVMDTAKQTGKTVDQVREAAKAKGYVIK